MTFGLRRCVAGVVTAALAHLVLGVEVRTALLLGAAVSSTDAAAVFSVLKPMPVPVPRLLRARLEAESGLKDPLVIIRVRLVASEAWGDADVLEGLRLVSLQFSIGGLIGLGVARRQDPRARAHCGVRLRGITCSWRAPPRCNGPPDSAFAGSSSRTSCGLARP